MNSNTLDQKDNKPIRKNFDINLLVCGINTPDCSTYIIDKPEFILGKSPEQCDGVLSFSNEISRTHAKILWRDGLYYISDLESANKTFVNGDIVLPGQEVQLHPGDHITLSTYTFLVEKINK